MVIESKKLTELLNPGQLENAASVLRALSHPVRISIVELLAEEGELPVKSIHQTLGMEQAATSHHLGILRNKEIVLARRDGKQIFYSLSEEKMEAIRKSVESCTDD